jgi:hypothetical protein
VVADLVGDDVGLGEVSRRAQALAQRVVEAQVDVDLAVGRAVEGPMAASPVPQAVGSRFGLGYCWPLRWK